MGAEDRLRAHLNALGHELSDLKSPPTHHTVKLYGLSSHVIPYRRVGRLVFTACVPTIGDKGYYQGTLGENRSVEEGYQAARVAAISALLGLRYATEDLERVQQLVRVFCFVICTPEFTGLMRVAEGAWDVLTDVLGSRGGHVRVPVGMTGLAGGHCLELVLTTQVAV